MNACLSPLALLGLLVATSCSSIDWRNDPAEETVEWRGRKVFRTEQDVVLATREGTAEGAAEFMLDLRAKLAEKGVELGPALLVAVDREEPPLFEDPMTGIGTMSRLHQRVTGVGDDGRGVERWQTAGRDGKQPITQEEAIELFAPIVAAGVPLEASELDLPPSLLEGADWAFVFPTDAGIADTIDEMVDIAIEREGGGFAARTMLALMGSSVLEPARAKMRARRNDRLLEVILAASTRRGVDAEALEASVRESLELSNPRDGVDFTTEVESTKAETLNELRERSDAVLLDREPKVAIQWGGSVDTLALRMVGFRSIVENHSVLPKGKPTQVAGRADGSSFLVTDDRIEPGDVQAWFDKTGTPEGVPRSVFVHASTRRNAAELAVLLLRRLEGLDDGAAKALWRELGMSDDPDFLPTGKRP